VGRWFATVQPNKSPEATRVGVFRYSLWSFGFS
jgi:hypothetical protein